VRSQRKPYFRVNKRPAWAGGSYSVVDAVGLLVRDSLPDGGLNTGYRDLLTGCDELANFVARDLALDGHFDPPRTTC